jgi:hypothetical protein
MPSASVLPLAQRQLQRDRLLAPDPRRRPERHIGEVGIVDALPFEEFGNRQQLQAGMPAPSISLDFSHNH